MAEPKAEDESQLGATHTVTPAQAGVSGGVGTPAGAPAPGDLISGKYRIEECLGKGGMGMVFRATHLLSEKRVALKWMLRPISDAQAAGRFVREARAAARIDHPNVVDLYDVGEHGGFGYLVMELLHGESLWDRLGRGTLGITDAVDLILPAMRGVAAAHAAGVIHRDLKPHNVFLSVGPDGIAREAKVLDFGISSFTNADATDPTLTKEGTILGTPAYMSPEQLRSSIKLDPRTDVYSMGVILYEAVTGRVPFEEPSFTSLVIAIANQTPPAPSSLRPELSPELEQVIMRAIARERDHRFPDMACFIAALEPFGSQLRASGQRTEPGVTVPRPHAVTPASGLAASSTSTLALAPEPGPSSGSQDPVPPVAVAPRRRRVDPAPAGRRWSGLLALALIASILGWWIARGGRRAVEPASSAAAGAGAATGGTAQAAEHPAPVDEAVTASGVARSPEPEAARPAAPTSIAAPRTVPTAAEPATSDGPRAAKPDRRTPRGAAAATPASKQAPTQPPRPPAGRSGTLSLDDMF